jgi:hypothetical protein
MRLVRLARLKQLMAELLVCLDEMEQYDVCAPLDELGGSPEGGGVPGVDPLLGRESQGPGVATRSQPITPTSGCTGRWLISMLLLRGRFETGSQACSSSSSAFASFKSSVSKPSVNQP